ncbi:hypothetical protein ACWD4F_21855 [Streptomyces aureus]
MSTPTGGGLAPFVIQRRGEEAAPADFVFTRSRPGRYRLRYIDEDPRDRDLHGVLWGRCSFNPVDDQGCPTGEPEWKMMHPFRQRIQSATPHVQRLTMNREGSTEEVLIDVTSGSWAALYDDSGRWIVRQAGPENLWDSIEEHLSHWHAAGTPALEEFKVTLAPDGQSLRW